MSLNQLLKVGQSVRTESDNLECRITEFLGGGGQGEVYKAVVSGQSMAVKWYFPQQATGNQRASLVDLIRKGPPNARFLWPLDLVINSTPDGFGYLMPLRDARFKGIVDLVKRRIEPTFRSLALAGLGLANSYMQLHSKGLCYRDISFGNAFFDPRTGEVLICDNDNVSVDGDTQNLVYGTPRFMAPEIVRGEARPGTQTDLFSLAVLLFYMFMIHHPLEGEREAQIHSLDTAAMNLLYGHRPVFIFDPKDTSNRPVKGYQDNALAFWPIYPTFLRDMFTRSFTDGIRDPQHGRVRESEWRAAMARLHDAMHYCGLCGAENFYDVDALQATKKIGTCWSCQKQLQLPFRIRIGESVIMLNHDSKLYAHHVDPSDAWSYATVHAEVVRHPSDPKIWGLKNVSKQRWNCTASDGRILDVDTGRSVSLANGTKIQFGRVDGEIRR